jgi:hypothetical protein
MARYVSALPAEGTPIARQAAMLACVSVLLFLSASCGEGVPESGKLADVKPVDSSVGRLFDSIDAFPRGPGLALVVTKRSSALEGHVGEPYFVEVRMHGKTTNSWTAHPTATFLVVRNGLLRIDFDPDAPLDESNGFLVFSALDSGRVHWRVKVPSGYDTIPSGGFWSTDVYIERRQQKDRVVLVVADRSPHRRYVVDMVSGQLAEIEN